MEWKRFPIPEFDHRVLMGLTYEPPSPISADKAQEIASAAANGDASVAGGYIVEPDSALLERLNFRGEHSVIVLCAIPGADAHLLGRSRAWFNQNVTVLDGNHADATTLYDWHTPRTFNTILGPENGVSLEPGAVWILAGRVLGDHIRANKVMFDANWSSEDGRKGFRVITASDAEPSQFHDSCFELTWAA